MFPRCQWVPLTVCCLAAAFPCSAAAGEVEPFLPPAADKTPLEVREQRNKFFNVRSGFSMISTENSSVPAPHTIVDFAPQPELPYDDTDTVVVGSVRGTQPFLSADEKGLYTEYTLDVAQVVKNVAPTPLLSDDTIALLRQGGAARMPDGRVVRHLIYNDVTLVKSGKYLLFLKYNFTLRAFVYLKVWLVDEGERMTPVFPDDIAREHSGRSTFARQPLQKAIDQMRYGR